MPFNVASGLAARDAHFNKETHLHGAYTTFRRGKHISGWIDTKPRETLTQTQEAVLRNTLARKSFLSGIAPVFGGTSNHPFSRRNVKWANTEAPDTAEGALKNHPRFWTYKPAAFLEEMHYVNKIMGFFLVAFPVLHVWTHMSLHTQAFTWGDYRLCHIGNFDTSPNRCSTNSVRFARPLPNELGMGSQVIDWPFRARWRQEQEATKFRQSVSKKATVAPWSSLRKEEYEGCDPSWKWDPKFDAEHRDAQRMLKELEEAKKIGGKTGRDEWFATYKARYDAKLPIPREWHAVFAGFPQHKHAILMLPEEMSFQAGMLWPTWHQYSIREEFMHPFFAWEHRAGAHH
eukprot:TRINITY_DN12557_c0_g1_i1.p2 TRINITY_DN12557_c0_g1~~TRINITY_DN12557_c0_g1_i1.p2  ORF type:complete len:345 (-),score=59.30 TRINITY_DN12557_c0_g1_i1:258-1292(-)